MKKLLTGGLIAVVALVVIGGIVWISMGGCSVDKEITKPVEKRDLPVEEIRQKLQGNDLQKREAMQQIEKLEPDEKRRVLLALAQDPDAATRIRAVKKLRAIDHPEAKAALARIAKEDPDETVRQLAAGQ